MYIPKAVQPLRFWYRDIWSLWIRSFWYLYN